jgi:hypothetical protein
MRYATHTLPEAASKPILGSMLLPPVSLKFVWSESPKAPM